MAEKLIDRTHPMNVCRASAGTGKTFTLAAYYVGLLLSGEDYRSILAITFTNKATAEMSERILGYLYGIAHGEEDAFLALAKQFMVREAGSDEDLRRRAGECFRAMLQDYDNVQVQTIDSFLQTLLSGLAGVLNMSCGLNTELDVDHIIRQAVDQLLTTEMSAEDRKIIEEYMHFQLDKESHWDVRKSLTAMAKELYNESVQMLDADGKIVFDADRIAATRAAIEERLQTCDEVTELRKLLRLLDAEGDLSGVTNGKAVMTAKENIRRSLDDPDSIKKQEERFRGLTDGQREKAEKWKLPGDVVPNILRATDLIRRYRYIYNTLQLTIRFSRDMQLMGSLQALIQRNLAEANSALLAKTANTLSNALRDGDADFILEKAGIRFRHILIDEFQDTSRLQWSVLDKLLRDVLAGEGHTLLIVGDIKQSIYRWRNGDWHIMASLDRDPFYGPMMNAEFPQLTKNFRSSEQVVNFNLSLFKTLCDEQPAFRSIYDEGFTPEKLARFYQAEKKPGGFVRFRAFRKPAQEAIVMDMFDTIEDLLRRGVQASQMMILVRDKKKEAAFITALHTDLCADELHAERFAHLRQTAIVSADCFQLEASTAVKVVIAALRFIQTGDVVEAKYIELAAGESRLQAVQAYQDEWRQLPLYELVCELVNSLLCDADGQYHGSETAYVNNLLDRTRAYVSAYGSSIDEFLVYWDDTMHSKPIPASATDAIPILTVHASKGLQAHTLFVPFCHWTQEADRHEQKIWCRRADEIEPSDDFVPISDGTQMSQSAYEDRYLEEHANMRIDNLNLLYVALTRAKENLYISAEFSVTNNGALGSCSHVGKYLLDFLGLDQQIVSDDLPTTADESPYAEYAVGEPVLVDRDNTSQANVFSFRGTPVDYAEVWSRARVRFVQSQEGMLYTAHGDEAYRRVARMEEGTLCHEIFAHLRKADELDAVLDQFRSSGQIADDEQQERLKSLISSAWKGNEQMRDWFTKPWQLHLEEAIYLDEQELRPDRVMVNPETNEAIVLDYKFGIWENKYIDQVLEYMSALRQMGYQRVRGYLWFARQNQLREVHE